MKTIDPTKIGAMSLTWATILFLQNFCHREHGEKRAFLGALCELCGKIDEDRDKVEIGYMKSMDM